MIDSTHKIDRRARQREATRRSILDSAREMLIQEGYEAFSMRKLARAVGYSPGAIYLYFETKEELLESLVEDAFDTLLEILDDIGDLEDTVQSLRSKLRAYIDFGLRFPGHYHLAFVRRPTDLGVTRETRPHGAFDVLRNSVHRCIQAGRFSSHDVEVTSQVLWATIHGITSLLITLPKFPWVDRESLIDEVVDNALRGLDDNPGRQTKQRDQQ